MKIAFADHLYEKFVYAIKMQLNCCLEGKTLDCGNFSS